MRLSHENGGGALEEDAWGSALSLSLPTTRTLQEGGHQQARKRTLTGNQRGQHLDLDLSSER